ncbi:hypothetical protein D3C71_1262180 [compost metagenome]
MLSYAATIPAGSDGKPFVAAHIVLYPKQGAGDREQFDNLAYPHTVVQPGDSGTALSQWDPNQHTFALQVPSMTDFVALEIGGLPQESTLRMLVEIDVDGGGGPDPEPGACFWTDLVRTEQICGGNPVKPDLHFVSPPIEGGSGGTNIEASHWIAAGPNMILATLDAWHAGIDDAPPAATLVIARDQDGKVLWDRAAASNAWPLSFEDWSSGTDPEARHLRWSQSNMWEGAGYEVPYVVELEFFGPSSEVIGTAVGEVTFKAGF